MYKLSFVKRFVFLERVLGLLLASAKGLFGPIGKCFNYWMQLRPFYQNLVVASLIVLSIQVFQRASFLAETEDNAMDLMINFNTQIASNKQYVWIDIDENTYRGWGEPYHIPRDKLGVLISVASKSKAKAIVVDVDLTLPGVSLSADDELKKVLSKYPPEAPPLILLRIPQQNKGEVLKKDRGSFFEMEATKPNIFWGQPTFYKDLYDQTVRRWKLLSVVCADGRPKIIPSVQLIVDMLDKGQEVTLRQLDAMFVNPDDRCDSYRLPEKTLQYGDRAIRLDATGQQQRLIYTIPDEIEEHREIPGFTRVPAHYIFKHINGGSFESILLDSVVVIGASYLESRDILWTPFDSMPGALILINAIKSLDEFGQLYVPEGWSKLVIQLVIITLMSWVFARFGAFWGMVLFFASIFSSLILLSWTLLKFGVWVDFSLPLLAMQIHQFSVEYWEGRVAKRSLQLIEEKDDSNP